MKSTENSSFHRNFFPGAEKNNYEIQYFGNDRVAGTFMASFRSELLNGLGSMIRYVNKQVSK